MKESQILKIVIIITIVVGALTLLIWRPNEPFQILALLGALSWIILISDLIIRLFIKPNITLILGKEIEIGFNSLGPIINNQIAIMSESKSSLINNIELTLKHKDNATYIFNWQWFEEKLYEMLIPENLQNINARKTQKATAIKINSNEMVEKKIGFQQTEHLNQFHTLTQKLTKKFLIIKSNPNEDIETLKNTNEYDNMKQLADNSFLWKVGKYEIEYKVFVMGLKKPFSEKQNFELTELDVSTLKLNILLYKQSIDVSYGLSDGNQPHYYWVNTQEK